MNTLVDQYTDRYFDPRRGQVIGVNYSPNGQAIEYELGLGNGKRMAGDALGIGIDGLSDLLYREKPRQLTPGELNDFFGGMDPGDLGLELLAGNPSFDITGRSGDARRKRRGLTEGDVNRLMNAYPDDAEKIRKMYLPGPTLRGV